MNIADITAAQSYDMVNTFQLKDDDLVLSHGMLLRLTKGRETCHGAMAFTGVIENPADVPDYVREFIGDSAIWRVQGNELATWMRVSETAAPAVANCGHCMWHVTRCEALPGRSRCCALCGHARS